MGSPGTSRCWVVESRNGLIRWHVDVVNSIPLGLQLRETQDMKTKGWTGARGGHSLC